ncbi:MAG: alpha/beta hydrolase [Phycisphaerales bacterium]
MTGLAVLLLIAAVATVLILSGVIAYDAIHPPRRTAGYAIAYGMPADPGDKELDYEEWTLDLPHDVKLPVWEIAARGAGPTAVFVHGWGESRIEMLARIEPWLDHADRIVLYDRRGHGDATGGTARLGTDEHLDLMNLLERLGTGSVVLVGYGSGATVAIATAADVPGGLRVAAYGVTTDAHTAFRDRLQARGLPTRPLTDLAMFWLRLSGIQLRDVEQDKRRLKLPLLIDPDPAAALSPS